ncbi:hypothetical protein R6Q59_021422 [Mikania micrantha]
MLTKFHVFEGFFGWYYAASAMAVLVAFTAIVYVQDHAGWKTKVKKSIFTSFVQVLVTAYKNHKVVAGPPNQWHHDHHPKDLTTTPPRDLGSDGYGLRI